MMDAKPWWKSKTLWVNIVVGGLASLELSMGLLQPLLPEGWYVAVAVGDRKSTRLNSCHSRTQRFSRRQNISLHYNRTVYICRYC